MSKRAWGIGISVLAAVLIYAAFGRVGTIVYDPLAGLLRSLAAPFAEATQVTAIKPALSAASLAATAETAVDARVATYEVAALRIARLEQLPTDCLISWGEKPTAALAPNAPLAVSTTLHPTTDATPEKTSERRAPMAQRAIDFTCASGLRSDAARDLAVEIPAHGANANAHIELHLPDDVLMECLVPAAGQPIYVDQHAVAPGHPGLVGDGSIIQTGTSNQVLLRPTTPSALNGPG